MVIQRQLRVQKLRINSDASVFPQTISRSARLCYVHIFLQVRTNVSLFESVIRLMPAKLWNILETRMLYDKCIEN